MQQKNILLIGAMPPPSGGVSMHLSRILERSRVEADINLCVLDLRRMCLHTPDDSTRNLFRICRTLFRARVVHLHISRKFKLFLAYWAKFIGKKVVYTHHNSRELSEPLTFSVLRKVDKIILVLPLMDELPEEFHDKCVVIPAYLPAISEEKLPEVPVRDFANGKVLFSLCYQQKRKHLLIGGKDLYGFDLIFDALEILMKENRYPSLTLFLADPANAMKEYYTERMAELSGKTGLKIIYWNKELDFSASLKYCSLLIRATLSDGDAVSVREALDAGIPVLASDCVVRPEGVNTFTCGDAASLANSLRALLEHPVPCKFPQPDYAPAIFNVYRALADSK